MLQNFLKRSFSYNYDLAIIGGGPGGYVAAIKAAQLGQKTVCIEKRSTLGGTCLNVGCIPAKSLLNSSHKYYEAKNHFKSYGINFSDVQPDLKQMVAMKNKSITGLTTGIKGLFKKYKVDHINAYASFKDPHTINIEKDTITAKNIILATGSEPTRLPGGILPIDEQRVLSSTGAMELQNIPEKMVVIGAGVIGLELGSVYARLGTDVTIVEFQPRIAGSADLEAAKSLQKVLVKQDVKFLLSTKVTGGEVGSSGVKVNIESQDPKAPTSLEGDYVLVATGRRPYTEGLGLDKIDVSIDDAGRINVNQNLQTYRHSHIYAIGDCVRGPMLAHKAEEEGIFVAERLAGKGGHINYHTIPWVIYTHPEIAWVGHTEESLKAENIPYNKGVFYFMANSRARANHDTDGLVKVLSDKNTDALLGMSIVNSLAGEMIMEGTLALEYGASVEDIARTCHAHPGFSEAIKEACLAAYDMPIHS